MKVYQVRMDHFDGDHDFGLFGSPVYTKKEDAEKFKTEMLKLMKSDDYDARSWWGMFEGEDEDGSLRIIEMEVESEFKEIPLSRDSWMFQTS